MSTYVMSDLHGHYDEYLKMLEKIAFKEEDVLYIVGDVTDRGKDPVALLEDMMKRRNVIPLMGNHDTMTIRGLEYYLKTASDNPNTPRLKTFLSTLSFQLNRTVADITRMDKEKIKVILDYLRSFELYKELTIGERSFILVHAGFMNFKEDRPLSDYRLEELVTPRPDYNKPYFKDRYVISGHTPTLAIPDNKRPGYIYQHNMHICIDCGAGMNRRLGCLCLETMEEYYVECH